MNKLSHMIFAISLFVGLYSLIYTFSVWRSGVGQIVDLLGYYIAGGVIATVAAVPILLYRAPHREMGARTTSNRSSAAALAFVTFSLGSLFGSIVYQFISGVPIIGNISIFIGCLIMLTGALMPDWDIPFLGISRHRNIIFHSIVLPMLVVFGMIVNVATTIFEYSSYLIGANVEYYITALFLLGYASHLYLDIFPSDANPFEILWKAANPYDDAPTGLKPLGPIKITKRSARGWLVGNATVLLVVALVLLGLYFVNLPELTFSP
ncbi:MAG: hypothetical protein JSW61_09590 [Candidatus Thorarchaeota archaeon]|nr:MAG: hypothetical protein JSW61_09590 [Candidatus Thorarchaeota archaeon]